ncbi:hypothetical protein TRVA0_079S00298 [Trichomonascus vanleenenianus]|uniref:uncharacterized protein n=1 Tax=Trichomonascus vanleenenianus TaxID=2268995 RepID=UPI003ECB714B
MLGLSSPVNLTATVVCINYHCPPRTERIEILMSRPVSAASSLGDAVEIALPCSSHFRNGVDGNASLNKFLAGLARSKAQHRRSKPTPIAPAGYGELPRGHTRDMKADDLATITISYYSATLISVTAVLAGNTNLWSYDPRVINVMVLEEILADVILLDVFDFVELEIPEFKYQPGEYMRYAVETTSAVFQLTLCADSPFNFARTMTRFSHVDVLTILMVGPQTFVVYAAHLSELRVLDCEEDSRLILTGVIPGAMHLRLQEVVDCIWITDANTLGDDEACTGLKKLIIDRAIDYGEEDGFFSLISRFPWIDELTFSYPDLAMEEYLKKALSKYKIRRIVPQRL